MSTSKIVLQILKICITVLLFILIVLGVMRIGKKAYELGYRVFTEAPVEEKPGTDVIVQVKEGDSAFSLGTRLEEKGLVEDAYLFVIQMKLSAYLRIFRHNINKLI